SFRSIESYTFGFRSECERHCVLIDLGTRCTLRESLEGYQGVLTAESDYLPEAKFDAGCRYRTAIVPGLGTMNSELACTLWSLLEAGTNLLLESGAGFLNRSEFTSHREMMNRCFDVPIDSCIDLWSPESSGGSLLPRGSRQHLTEKLDHRKSVPYVNYVWPSEATIRDFSRAVPVPARTDDVIGRVGDVPVALKKRVGKGILIFLGSPMGPALRAGDNEARSWLQLVTAL